MENQEEKISRMAAKLDSLLEKQRDLMWEIQAMRKELGALKGGKKDEESSGTAQQETEANKTTDNPQPKRTPPPYRIKTKPIKRKPLFKRPELDKKNWEAFIGENLISKIAIVILVFGVGIGAKYAIDNELISPLTRIILGYLGGLVLLGFAIRLQKNYLSFSAVLLSGSMSILFFITFAAYDFYSLIPQAFAFALMVVFTAFTVLAALRYDKPIIAHLGLVGAYAVPFLLSDGSGRVAVLFSYMGLINAGILIIAFKKAWSSLYYAAFFLTWLIYTGWHLSDFDADEQLVLALGFSSLFFLLFYAIQLAYKLVQQKAMKVKDTIMILLNAFVYFGYGYSAIDLSDASNEVLTLFTLFNALVHFTASIVVYRSKTAGKELLYLAIVLVLSFLTIAIPVQLDGSWVTLLWAAEAVLLFWLGRSRVIPIYERLAYPLMLLAFFSLLQDWDEAYAVYGLEPEDWMTPFFNLQLFSSCLVLVAFGVIVYRFFQPLREGQKPPLPHQWMNLMGYVLPALFLLTLYLAFLQEVNHFWDIRLYQTAIPPTGDIDHPQYNYHIGTFQNIWRINYTLFFVSMLIAANLFYFREKVLSQVGFFLGLLVFSTFLTASLYGFSELRELYLKQGDPYFNYGTEYLSIRYISYAFVALLLLVLWRTIQAPYMKKAFQVVFDFALHLSLLWIASSELIGLLDLGGHRENYKLGLSILWGIYSLSLIGLGIWRRARYLRIWAIVLFGVTLVKLAFYDLAGLDTIGKTIVLVSLGVLLLIISFLYNKYKKLIFEDREE